ncbi:transcriptional regulator [Chitinophaga sp. SYP-B3965]|uniref:helix-turn-helix and ligand-binding sensor domain-containing protein n=1 Tax=Chitinophaga sp. SYP-B3965 TaxID=2663120 RepID=UPI001299F7E0|nr:triple tyrosine motif-containing protein [Chitinophaga sp. SYP-B3965]MRG45085.1 transcriptional regulator [Chitinophaga sp. SYP-B3965]
MKKALAYITILLTFSSIPVSAQNTLGLPLIINYNKALYKGGLRTWDIKQDSRGIMYFANDEGLVTFNGGFWKLYPLPNKTILRSIYIDKHDRVYVGGQDEIGYFEPGANNVLQYTSVKNMIPAQYRNFSDIWNTVALGESIFFRASDRIFKLANNRIEVFLPSKGEWLFLGEAGGRLLAMDQQTGLLEYKRNKWMPLINGSMLKGLVPADIFENGEHTYIIATIDNKFFSLQNDSISRIQNIPWEDLYTPSFARISDSEYVKSTSKLGCVIQNFHHQFIQRISVKEGLKNNNATAVFVDKEKNIWVGVDNSISLINYNSPIKFLTPDTVNNVIGYSSIIFKNDLYVSSSNGLFMAPLSDLKGDLSLIKSRFSLVKNSDYGEGWQLEEINQEIFLAHNKGVFIIKNKQAVPVSAGAGSWTFLPTSSVYPVTDIVVGTYWGLDLLQYDGNGFHSKGALKGKSDSYRFLVQDEAGGIWASHPYRGIYQIQVSPDSMKYNTRLFTSTDGLPSNFNNYVFKIRNRIVFSTESGVYEFDPATAKLVPSKFLSVFNGLPVRYMKEDDKGNIWFCSGKKLGIAHFSPNDQHQPYTISYFPELEGYTLSNFDNIYPYNQQNIFIGSENGAIHIDYEKYAAQKLQPTVLLNEIKAIGEKDSLVFGGFFLPNKKEVTLSSIFSSFHFEFSSPIYGRPNNIEYSYRLEGYEKEWSAWTSKKEKDYTNLPAGKYTFNLKARDNLNHESAPVLYTFIIMPPWYNSIWAKAIYLLILCLLFYLLNRWHRRKLLQQQKKFEEKQKQLEYIHQLELEKNEKEIIKLQNENLASEVALKNKELASSSMQLEENANTFHKLREEVIKLDNNPDNKSDIKSIISLLKEVEDNNANWDKFAVHFDEANDNLLKKLKKNYPKLSQSELKICAYLYLNFSSKQISQLSNVTVRGVEIHRYRIRKKLGLQTGESLNSFLGNL